MIPLTFVAQTRASWQTMVTKLEVNVDLKDVWYVFKPDAIASYKQCLLKLILDAKKVYYCLLTNVFISYVDSKITIQYNNEKLAFYQQKATDFTQAASLKATYKQNLQKLMYYKASKNLNLSYVNQALLDELELANFQIKALLFFQLEPTNYGPQQTNN